LGLDEQQQDRLPAQEVQDGRKNPAERDERDVDRHKVDVFREETAVEMPDIGALDGDDAGVLTEFPGQLPIGDIDGVDLGNPFLKQAVGETARRSPDVERDPAADVEAEGIERPLELHAAPADIGMVFPAETNRRSGGDERPRLVDGDPVDQDGSRQDQGLRLFPRRRHAPFHQQSV